jgi:hypothetical protein
VFPEIVPGCGGTGLTVTANVCGILLPQPLFAVTETLPLFAPTIAVIEVVADVPVHPVGNVHVYDVAPVTGLIE